MSVIVGFKIKEEAFQLLTDCAQYDEDGVVWGYGSKVLASPVVPVAIATRGRVKLGRELAQAMLAYAEEVGFDAAIDGWSRFMRLPALDRLSEDHAVEFTFAGWSERGGPAAYCARTHAVGQDAPVREVWRLPDAFGSGPSFTVEDQQATLWPREGEDQPQGVEVLRRFGGRFMARLRQKSGAVPNGSDGRQVYLLGGGVELTTVTAAGVTVEELCRFNDAIGERINPFTADGNVVPLLNLRQPRPREQAGMNRQQRRAAERANRRKLLA